jgi:hypothetical protein
VLIGLIFSLQHILWVNVSKQHPFVKNEESLNVT